MGYSAKYYCEKCDAHSWMKVSGDPSAEKVKITCAECKTTYANVDFEKPVEDDKNVNDVSEDNVVNES
ncbi:MAG: hypothetical protein P9M13_09005 [Candidatus Ancaeobacter aquaticus]|nr:hypothetical protein [Candidatus Ancaeobacter aquaticus]